MKDILSVLEGKAMVTDTTMSLKTTIVITATLAALLASALGTTTPTQYEEEGYNYLDPDTINDDISRTADPGHGNAMPAHELGQSI